MFFNDYFEKLAGTANLREQIIAGKTEKEVDDMLGDDCWVATPPEHDEQLKTWAQTFPRLLPITPIINRFVSLPPRYPESVALHA